ncbi:MAG TPA: hypothetical protein VGG46_13980 [Terriglobales bacterium]
MKHAKCILFAAAFAALVLPAAAQTTTSSNSNTPPQTIQQRKENQQDRIGNGVQSGQLTAGETGHLEKQETDINHEEKDMRKLDDGHLTATDKTTVNQQQNHVSNEIYNDKHNDRTQNTDPKSEVGQRQRNQQDRIAQGIKSGQLKPGETAHLENHEAHVNREVHRDRAANGGKLTAGEKARVNRQQNRDSRRIYRDKHNGRRA